MPRRRRPPPSPCDSLPTFGRWLTQATDVIDIGKHVCAAVEPLFGIDACVLAIHRAEGGPALAIDNLPETEDSYRIALVAPGSADTHDDMTVLPVVDTWGTIGTIRCRSEARLDDASTRGLATLPTLVSVRCAQLGITAIGSRRVTGHLSPRQYEVAALVARGGSNGEIALALEISTNTVKKLLKDTFRRLDVHTRTELALAFRSLAAPLDVPVGITRLGAVTVTRGE